MEVVLCIRSDVTPFLERNTEAIVLMGTLDTYLSSLSVKNSLSSSFLVSSLRVDVIGVLFALARPRFLLLLLELVMLLLPPTPPLFKLFRVLLAKLAVLAARLLLLMLFVVEMVVADEVVQRSKKPTSK